MVQQRSTAFVEFRRSRARAKTCIVLLASSVGLHDHACKHALALVRSYRPRTEHYKQTALQGVSSYLGQGIHFPADSQGTTTCTNDVMNYVVGLY